VAEVCSLSFSTPTTRYLGTTRSESMISKDNAYALIHKSGNLPTLPAILLKLLAACDDDDTPLTEIAAIINRDPVLSFKVLQLVNSAYYGFRYSFKGIEQAVIYLGANTIKNLAITMSIHQVFERKRFKNIQQFNINVFWYHSLLCATLAKRIAQKVEFGNIEEAYLSGLLHDIGRLVLISTFPKEHETILAEKANGKDTLWAEKQLLGLTHCETGAWLMEKWNLSSMMAQAIQYHHEPLEKIKEAFPLVKIVYISNLLSENGLDPEDRQQIKELLEELQNGEIQEIAEGAAEEVEQIAANLDITIQIPAETDLLSSKQTTVDRQGLPHDSDVFTPETMAAIAAGEGKEGSLQQALAARIKSVSLLTTFLENLVKTADVNGIISACERAMSILLNIDKVLFFLTDKNKVLLHGFTSPANSLHQMSQGLTLTLQRSTSLVVKTYHDMAMTYLTNDTRSDNLADEQLLTGLKCKTVLLVPLVADDSPAGVILLGLPDNINLLSAADRKLVQVIAQQVGLCLQLEKMKEQKTEELNAERMAAVSMTARKIAHEINNPLGIISNYIVSMKLRLADNDQMKNELGIIDDEIHRISSMIDQLNTFSQEPVQTVEMTNINAAIEDIIHLVRSAHLTSQEVAISFIPDRDLPDIPTSKDAVKQILLNLLKNSVEAMNQGGEITVTTRKSDRSAEGSDREGVEIRVTDTGPGLPEFVMANLYAPLITTKKSGHSGLGLSIVHKTVKDLGGTLSCTSSPMDGTTFSIFLPGSAKDKLN